MNHDMKRKAEDDQYETGRARKRRRAYAGVFDPTLFLPMPEAGYQNRSRDTIDLHESNSDLVPANGNVAGNDDSTNHRISAMSRGGDRIKAAAPIGGRHCLVGFRVVVLKTPTVAPTVARSTPPTGGQRCLVGFRVVLLKTSPIARVLPLLPVRPEQAEIMRPPIQAFAAEVAAVPSSHPPSSPQDRVASESSQADSLATSNDRDSPQRNANVQRLDRGRSAFERGYQIDNLVQSASRLDPKSSALSIVDQIPDFEPLGEVSGIDLLAIPKFDKEYRVVEPSWNIAFFLV